MSSDKIKRLQAAGWKVSDVQDFLQLSDEEACLTELKLSLIGGKYSQLKPIKKSQYNQ